MCSICYLKTNQVHIISSIQSNSVSSSQKTFPSVSTTKRPLYNHILDQFLISVCSHLPFYPIRVKIQILFLWKLDHMKKIEGTIYVECDPCWKICTWTNTCYGCGHTVCIMCLPEENFECPVCGGDLLLKSLIKDWKKSCLRVRNQYYFFTREHAVTFGTPIRILGNTIKITRKIAFFNLSPMMIFNLPHSIFVIYYTRNSIILL